MPVTVCWSAKGGSGATVVAATLALACPTDSLLIDLDGELPVVLGLPEQPGQGVADWLASDAPATALDDLALEVDRTTRLIPRGGAGVDPSSTRWAELATWLARTFSIVDAGTGPPPEGLLTAGVRSLLVTRTCYLALRRAAALPCRPDGVVVLTEPGRSLQPPDVARALGAPVVATVSHDPTIARAVDAGLLTTRLPRLLRKELRGRGMSERSERMAARRASASEPTGDGVWGRSPHGDAA